MQKAIVFLFSLFLLAACSPNETKTSSKVDVNNLPGLTGSVGEILVILPNSAWKGTLGEKIRKVFAGEKFGLPQDEPHFDVAQVPEESFTSIMRKHRNVVRIVFDPKYKEPEVEITRSVFSRDQFVLALKSANEKELDKLLQERGAEFVATLNEVERNRLIADYKRVGDAPLKEKLLNKYQVGFTFQKGFKIATEEDNFVWARLEKSRIKDGFRHFINTEMILHTIPMGEQNLFSVDSLKAYRDTLTKTYLQGADSSYMAISYKLFGPEGKRIKINGLEAIEMRGLWRKEGGFMGGPFISLLIKDEKRNRYILADASVFAPGFDKREYLREAEAMLYSVQFAN